MDRVEQHPGQLGVMIIEVPVERLDQRGVLGAQLAQRHVREHMRVPHASDERLHHRPSGLAEDVRGNR
jgi:hypothetical protein